MQYRPKLMDVDENVIVVVKEIPDTMVLIVIILRKWKPHCTTRSGTIRNGTILRQNKKMDRTDSDGSDLTYYDKINIDWCYFIYKIIYYYILYLHLIYFVVYIMPCFFLFFLLYEIHVLFGLKMYVSQTVRPRTQFFEIKDISSNWH